MQATLAGLGHGDIEGIEIHNARLSGNIGNMWNSSTPACSGKAI